MITTSLRWRLIAWNGLLLAALLAGFIYTAYAFSAASRLAQIDDVLRNRLSVLSDAIRFRGAGGPGGPGGPGALRSFDERGPRQLANRPTVVNGTSETKKSRSDLPAAPADNAMLPDGPPPMGELPPEPPGETDGTQSPDSRLRNMLDRPLRISEEVEAQFSEPGPGGCFYLIWTRTGREVKRSDNAPAGLARPTRGSQQSLLQTYTVGEHRLACHFSEWGEAVVTGTSLAAFNREMRGLLTLLLAVGTAVLALGLGGIWLVTTGALRPVDAISAAAQRISGGRLAERIAVSDSRSELGRLAGVLNETFARLESAFAEQRQFTADASHELRTPLTIIIAEAQRALNRERPAADYRESLESCLEAAQQMRRLVDSLLELARFDAGQNPLHPVKFDLADTAQACVEMIEPLAEAQGIAVVAEIGPVIACGDPARIRQVVTNLLANALYYNVPKGGIRVQTRVEGGEAVLAVIDTGKGIEPADLPHIFKRFYRADKARGNTDQRSGLGLTIVKSIIDAHGGRITVQSTPGQGSTFTVYLPMS